VGAALSANVDAPTERRGWWTIPAATVKRGFDHETIGDPANIDRPKSAKSGKTPRPLSYRRRWHGI